MPNSEQIYKFANTKSDIRRTSYLTDDNDWNNQINTMCREKTKNKIITSPTNTYIYNQDGDCIFYSETFEETFGHDNIIQRFSSQFNESLMYMPDEQLKSTINKITVDEVHSTTEDFKINSQQLDSNSEDFDKIIEDRDDQNEHAFEHINMNEHRTEFLLNAYSNNDEFINEEVVETRAKNIEKSPVVKTGFPTNNQTNFCDIEEFMQIDTLFPFGVCAYEEI